jgi:hypothetical protein
MGPLKNIDASPPHEKRTHTYEKKLAAFQTLTNCHGTCGAIKRKAERAE